MIPFKAGSKEINIPSSWDDITLAQFSSLRKCDGDFCKMLEVLTGEPSDFWDSVEIGTIELDTLVESVGFFKIPPPSVEGEKPLSITINEKLYDVPQDLSVKALGQRMMFEKTVFPLCNLIKTGQGVKLQSIEPEAAAAAIAIYMQPIVSGKLFSSSEATTLIKQIDKCKVSEAFPVANFFLRKYFAS